MFEKEAEEYLGNLDECRTKDLMRSAFKDGAELGFQKGIKARINTTTISDCPIKDEWQIIHRPEDLPQPRNDRKVLVWFKAGAGEPEQPLVMNADRFGYDGGVYAWKEIVPPKTKAIRNSPTF